MDMWMALLNGRVGERISEWMQDWWVSGWMDGRTSRWMGGRCTDRWEDEQGNGLMDVYVGKWICRQMNEWMGGWVYGKMDR